MSEVGIAHLRRDLKEWLGRAQNGDEVIVTDRGKPVARLTGIDVPFILERLVAEGRISQPRRSRPQARDLRRVHAAGAVSEHVVAEREARRG
jgi:prevent-host-death family protein